MELPPQGPQVRYPLIGNYGCGGANKVKDEELLDHFCFFYSRVREFLDLKR